MDPVLFRRLTIVEQRALRQEAQGKALVVHVWKALWLFMLVTSLGSLAITCFAGRPGKVQLAILASIAGGLALWSLWVRERMNRPVRASLVADLAGGRAIVEIFDAVDAIELPDCNMVEGSSYFLKLADGRVLYLCGPHLAGQKEQFPSTHFAISRLPRSRIIVGLEIWGEELRPSSQRYGFSMWDPDIPKDGEILQVDFESLRRADHRSVSAP